MKFYFAILSVCIGLILEGNAQPTTNRFAGSPAAVGIESTTVMAESTTMMPGATSAPMIPVSASDITESITKVTKFNCK